MDFAEIAAVCALELRRRKKMKNKKKYWVHPITSQRLMKGQFYELHNELRSYPDKFFNFYRMSVKSFDDLLNFIRPFITYQDTMWRKAIPPAERLSVTLRQHLYSRLTIRMNSLKKCTTDFATKMKHALQFKVKPPHHIMPEESTNEREVRFTELYQLTGNICNQEHLDQNGQNTFMYQSTINEENQSGTEVQNPNDIAGPSHDYPKFDSSDNSDIEHELETKLSGKISLTEEQDESRNFATVVKRVSSYYLDEEVVQACLRRMQRMCPEFLFTNSYTAKGILMLNNANVEDLLDPLRAKKYKVVFFILNTDQNEQHTSEKEHSSLLAYYKDYKTFFHFDSILSKNRENAKKITTKCNNYFKIKNFIDVPCQQQNMYADSKVCVVENMTKLIYIYDSRVIYKNLTPIHIRKLNSCRPDVIRSFIVDEYIIEKLKQMNNGH